jgi:transglutaminase-like putative cysteine protease
LLEINLNAPVSGNLRYGFVRPGRPTAGEMWAIGAGPPKDAAIALASLLRLLIAVWLSVNPLPPRLVFYSL